MRTKLKQFIFIIKGNEYHHIPHVHIQYQNNEVSVNLLNLTILAGSISNYKKALKLLQDKPEFVEQLTKDYFLMNPNLK